MNELTIGQMQVVVGWSYPTALNFAKAHGHMINGKWYIPFNAVSAIVQEANVDAQRMQNRLVKATMENGGKK